MLNHYIGAKISKVLNPRGMDECINFLGKDRIRRDEAKWIQVVLVPSKQYSFAVYLFMVEISAFSLCIILLKNP